MRLKPKTPMELHNAEQPEAVLADLEAKHGSATAIRYEMELTALARVRLSQHPHLQAEAIAKHYTAHATIALQLLKMLECRRHIGCYPELDRSIQMLVDEIKTNHRHDFGIELEWPNAPGERPAGNAHPTTPKTI